MPCYFPLDAWQRAPGVKPVFKFRPGFEHLTLPCGRCTGCRLERSRQWAMRCVHEASLYDHNCFITLTYAENPISFRKSDLQKFFKRLRHHFPNATIRYFACAEYGERLNRPHFHACIFGFDFPDKVLLSVRGGVNLYRSDILSDIWGLGFCSIGDVTFESAAYVARYVLKKINGKDADEHYEHITPEGEVIDRAPESVYMSRRPGIASDWYDLFKRDLEKDFLTMRGQKMRPPRFYDRCLHRDDPTAFDIKKNSRKAKALENAADNTPARLLAKRQIKERKLKILNRGLENET